MCGIAGITRTSGAPPLDPEVLGAMLRAIVHRGPDSEGSLIRERLLMGMRRLAIIDLNTGDQPIYNEDRSAAIVFNGEVYNYRQLRDSLEALGHVFTTRSDTEAILHCWEEYGSDCPRYLSGMFVFSICDLATGAVFCARDRLGQKPFFYRLTDDGFAWASEIRSLLAAGGSPQAADLDGLAQFLTFGYSTGQTTCFEGVRRLPPAHWCQWSDGKLTIERYWSPRPAEPGGAGISARPDELIASTRSLLEDAVDTRLIADVPLGAMLSGGIDSSIVVGLMASRASEPVRTFTIGFDEPGYDERHFARLVSRRFSTVHHERTIRADDLLAALGPLVWHLEEPNIDPAFLPTFFLSQLCREHVTVALCGDGGDEAFGGYGRYQAALLAQRLRWLPKPAIRLAGVVVRALRSSRANYEFRSRALRMLDSLAETGDCRFVRMLAAFSDAWRRGTSDGPVGRELLARSSAEPLLSHLAAAGESSTLARLATGDYLQHLPDQLLVKSDRASMANALEVRAPFLDHRVVEFSLSVPDEFKIRGRARKWLLLQAFQDILPPEVIRGGKRAFNVPLGAWFAGDLGNWAEGLLLSDRSLDRGIFARDALRVMFADHRSRRENHGSALWALMLLELWLRMFIDALPPPGPPPIDIESTRSLFAS